MSSWEEVLAEKRRIAGLQQSLPKVISKPVIQPDLKPAKPEKKARVLTPLQKDPDKKLLMQYGARPLLDNNGKGQAFFSLKLLSTKKNGRTTRRVFAEVMKDLNDPYKNRLTIAVSLTDLKLFLAGTEEWGSIRLQKQAGRKLHVKRLYPDVWSEAPFKDFWKRKSMKTLFKKRELRQADIPFVENPGPKQD